MEVFDRAVFITADAIEVMHGRVVKRARLDLRLALHGSPVTQCSHSEHLP